MEVVVGLGIAIAVGAAVRSTWSPCGQSMLSQITPFTERARHQRFGVTAGWFVVGSVLGGATLGVIVGARARQPRRPPTCRVDTALGDPRGLALVAAAVDGGVFGFRPPFFRRQVNEDWLPRYRGWLYGVGFGWQVGVGVATYIMTAAVFLTVAVGVLTADPRGRVRDRRAVRSGARAHRVPHREGAHARAAGVVPSPLRRVGRADSPRRSSRSSSLVACARRVWRGASSGWSRSACAVVIVAVVASCRRLVAARAQESTARAHA